MSHVAVNCEALFSPDFSTARKRFRERVQMGGGQLDILQLAPKGPSGEDLSIDIAWLGSKKPRRVFVHSSGLHGVEAFAGSAIQLQWLEEGIPPLPQDSAILLAHVLNPFGMAWLRRFNENNVDLNRNFLAADDMFTGAPEGYKRLDGFLNPVTRPSDTLFYVRAAWLLARFGMQALKQAIATGQYTNPRGLFFGGHGPENGPAKLQEYMTDHLANTERIVAIDVHTGLGRFGEDQLLVDAAPERAEVNRTLRRTFGECVQQLDIGGVAYEIRGAHYNMYYRLFPQAETHFAVQEFGTYNLLRVLQALRAENHWHSYGSGALEHTTKAALLEVFNPRKKKWRLSVLRRGREVMTQAVKLAFERAGCSQR